MAARILDGKALARSVRLEIGGEVARLKGELGRVPGLTVVLVGEVAASRVYVRNKEAAVVEAAGDAGRRRSGCPPTWPRRTSLATVDRLNADPEVHGILVQLPLPGQIDDRKVIERVDPRKDVDGFHPENAGLLAIGPPSVRALHAAWASASCWSPRGSRPGGPTR